MLRRCNWRRRVRKRSAWRDVSDLASRQDAKTARRRLRRRSRADLKLPDRDYYLRDDEKSKKLREAYVAHAQKLFELLGDPTDKAAAEAKTIMGIETALAKASMSNVDLRDPNKTYHRMSVEDVQTLSGRGIV